MNYIKITKNDIANGEGVRVVLWLSGCNHKCKGCHNPQAWDVNSGILFDEEAEKELFEALDKSYISGITFSGGDPLHENNIKDVLNLVNKIRLLLPEKTIWLYSGYVWEDIFLPTRDELSRMRRDIISQCDVFVDGRYIDELRNITLKWRGSRNQRVIDCKKSIQENKIILFTD
jgi:anaerobic ribonucleoside-triphosphate reductase activating protein